MKSLNDPRTEHGWFTYPMPDEWHAVVTRIDTIVEVAFEGLEIEGFKERFVRAARKDLAARALTAGDGYERRVHSFGDLTRAELLYVEAWLAGADPHLELKRLGWLPSPSPKRIAQLLKEDRDIPARTRQKLMERYMDGAL